MFDQILDNFRKATESTIKLQQEMTQQWFQQWASIPGLPNPGNMFGTTAAAAPVANAPKQASEAVTELLNKHLKTLDARSRAGIRTIEDAFRVPGGQGPRRSASSPRNSGDRASIPSRR